MTAYHLALVVTLAIVALLLTSSAGIRRGVRNAFAMPWPYAVTCGLAALTGISLIVLARRYLEVRQELVFLVVSTVVFGTLVLIALRFRVHTRTMFEWLESQSPVRMAGLSLVLGVLAGVVVLQSFPHVSDEVAYQFQARALAQGKLYFPAPPVAEAVTFIHTFVDGGRWYGIMNPGWPVFLSVGYVTGLPWLVNPILGALSLLIFAGFLRETGMDRRTSRFTILFLVISPFVIFMNGTFMSHSANFFLFAVFCWAWARLIRTGSIPAAIIAGLAVAWNLLVRPVDTAAVTFPFMVHGLIRMSQNRRLVAPVLLSGFIGLAGVAATLAYDHALTGDAMVMPVSRYFEARNPGERFGIGFGDDMGTSLHGDEWPGFHISDAFRVTAHRLVQFTRDSYGLPLLILALPLLAWWKRHELSGEWTVLIIAAAVTLTGVYFFHFYHGIAYGSRHLYLALPAVALLLGRFISLGTAAPESDRSALVRAGTVALVLHVPLFALPGLVREYGDNYRGSSAIVRKAVGEAELGRSLVFVEPGEWSWKSAFPLNEYPLDESRVLFVRDLPGLREEAIAEWPGREVWQLKISGGKAQLEQRGKSPSQFDRTDATDFVKPRLVLRVGGSGKDMVRDVAVDRAGSIYAAGSTQSQDFPVTTGRKTLGGESDAFVMKLAADGSSVWSRRLGGSGYDRVYGIEIAPDGGVLVAGRAGFGLEVTEGVLQPVMVGGGGPESVYGEQDGFICRLNELDGMIEFCTYFGNEDAAPIRDIAVDQAGDLYVISSAASGSFDQSWFDNAYQPHRRGGRDAFIAKISADGSGVEWATYLGGSGLEGNTNTIRVDSSGVYVAMFTHSGDFPTTGFGRRKQGKSDIYVAKLSLDGSELLWGNYVGGSGAEDTETHHLAIGSDGSVYVTGPTRSTDFPVTPGAWQINPGDEKNPNAFLARISPDGSRLLSATYIGGTESDWAEGIGIDSTGSIYVTGGTFSSDFPGIPGGGGAEDLWTAVFSPGLDRMISSSRIAGSGKDRGRSVAVARPGLWVAGGHTESEVGTAFMRQEAATRNTEDALIAVFEARAARGKRP